MVHGNTAQHISLFAGTLVAGSRNVISETEIWTLVAEAEFEVSSLFGSRSTYPFTSSKRSNTVNIANKLSVILVSPKNEILLLHRVQTSSSFASAHVFPGGNLSAQDGECPPEGDMKRHEDSPAYRRAAIRELFEESGILLAKDTASKKMLAVGEEARESGRKAIHQDQITFSQWLRKQNAAAEPDIGLQDH